MFSPYLERLAALERDGRPRALDQPECLEGRPRDEDPERANERGRAQNQIREVVMRRNLLRTLSISAVTLAIWATAPAQEKDLRLSVVDPRGKPIELVELTPRGKGGGGVTDSNGKAELRLAPAS